MSRRGLDFVLMGTDYSRYFIDKIAGCLEDRGLDFTIGSITANNFPAGHRFVQLDEDVRGNELWIIHSYLVNRPAISDMELFMIADAAKRSSCETFTICTTYSEFRQDKKSDGRVAIYAKLFADLLQKAGGGKFGRFATAHPHSEQVQGFFDVSVDTLPSLDVFEWYFTQVLFPHLDVTDPSKQVLVFAGDGGSVKVNRNLAQRLGCESLSSDKLRGIRSEGNVTETERPYNNNMINGKYILTLDDVCCSGGTLCDVATVCLEAGALGVYAGATAGLFSKKGGKKAKDRIREVERLKVITTDTIPRSDDYLKENKDWLVGFISMAPIYAELIYRTTMQESVSAMFRNPWDKNFDQRLRDSLFAKLAAAYKKRGYFVDSLASKSK